MNIHFSYKHTIKTPQVERLINRRIQKLNTRLNHFSPDAMHLHGSLEFQNPREGFVSSLNLRLPVGQLYATEAAKTAQTSLRAAFDELERQINKEKQLLRGDGKMWARPEAGTAEPPGRTAVRRLRRSGRSA